MQPSNQPFTGWPVYQPAWVVLTADAQNWVEVGTGHQCDAFRYWYWGYGAAGTWYPRGWTSQPNQDITVYLDIHRLGEYWHWFINGVERTPPMYWNAVGPFADFGLESYDDHAYIPSTLYGQLQMTRSEGPWIYFPSLTKRQTPGLCWSESGQYPGFYAHQDTSC